MPPPTICMAPVAICYASSNPRCLLPLCRPARTRAAARAAPAVVRAQQQPPREPASRTVGSRQLAAAVPAPGRTVSRRQPAPDTAPDAGSDDGSGQPVPLPGLLAKLDRQWAELPGRYKLVFATSLSFVICNMDKVGAGWWRLVAARCFAGRVSSIHCFYDGPAASAHRRTASNPCCWPNLPNLAGQHLRGDHPHGPRLWVEPHRGRWGGAPA